MNDETFAEELKAIPMPADLAPAGGFPDRALRRAARNRSRRMVAAVVAVVAVLTGATAVMGGGTGVPPADPAPSGSSSTLPDEAVPHPGGGPWVVHSFSEGAAAYLLDLRTGEYRGVPFRASTSSDGHYVAVSSADLGLGVAERNAYLDGGEAAVTWLGGPEITDSALSGIADVWSPDGTKVFGATTMLAEDQSSILDTLTSYELATGRRRVTTVPRGLNVRSVAWAPDSAGFVLAVQRDDGSSELRNLSADGVLGSATPLRGVEPALFGFSPDGRLLYRYDAMEDGQMRSRCAVLDPATGDTETELWTNLPEGASATPVEWLDDIGYVRVIDYIDRMTVEVVDAATSEPIRKVEWDSPVFIWSVGSSAGLPPEAADLGF